VESSTFLVFNSQPNFRENSTRFYHQILLFGGDIVGLSIATRYGASKSYAPTRNLCDDFLLGLRFRANFLNQIAFMADFFSLNVESFSLKNLGDLPFDQVILMLYLVSHILAQSIKI
jgi:hypothetical protein